MTSLFVNFDFFFFFFGFNFFTLFFFFFVLININGYWIYVFITNTRISPMEESSHFIDYYYLKKNERKKNLANQTASYKLNETATRTIDQKSQKQILPHHKWEVNVAFINVFCSKNYSTSDVATEEKTTRKGKRAKKNQRQMKFYSRKVEKLSSKIGRFISH